MIHIPAKSVIAALDYTPLIDALRAMFLADYTMPVRHHHFYETDAGIENTLILMPVWTERYLGVQQVVVSPANNDKGLPALQAIYTLLDPKTTRTPAQIE